MDFLIRAKQLTKNYLRGSEKVVALDNVSFDVERGNIVSIIGQSGSGKTTLVNIVGCLDNPTSGDLIIDNKQIFKDGITLNETSLTKIRRNIFGYVFQKFFLIPTLSVKENILLPSIFQKNKVIDDKLVDKIMNILDIKKRENHLPLQLSGGEMQRVAIARALINEPQVLIADEPTGNLDSKRTNEVKELFLRLNKEEKITIILVTHNPEFAKIGNKIIEISDGHLI
jgi:putative ABC transport system ATP-binding protein